MVQVSGFRVPGLGLGFYPGMMSPWHPASCSALRTSTASPPARTTCAQCSAKLPWSASTPIRTLPAADTGVVGAEDILRGWSWAREGGLRGGRAALC